MEVAVKAKAPVAVKARALVAKAVAKATALVARALVARPVVAKATAMEKVLTRARALVTKDPSHAARLRIVGKGCNL